MENHFLMNKQDFKKSFFIELHDVCPQFLKEFQMMKQWITPWSEVSPLVLWTPHWDGVEDHHCTEKLIDEILELECRIVLHGFTHNIKGTLWDKFLYGESVGAGFKNLDKEKSLNLLTRGRAVLEEWTGKQVDWFCAPRWQQGKATKKALVQLGFLGYLTKNKVVFLEGNVLKLKIPTLSFDHGTRKAVIGFNRWTREQQMKGFLKKEIPFRLVLHPRDMTSNLMMKEIDQIRDTLLSEGWRCCSFKQLEE
jgi:predicted deacetylase